MVRKLESIAPVSDEEKHAIAALPLIVRELKRAQDIVREQDRPSQCCLILEGLVCRYKILPAGKRQIFSFHIPGDIPDLQSLHLEVMDDNLGTLAPSRVAFITHEAIRSFLYAHPRIGNVFWRYTLIDAAVYREWIAGLGCREGYARMAHLLCELFVRLRAVGLTQGQAFEMHITQSELGEALGLSAVHVNRTLQRLRASGLISTPHAGNFIINNWNGLQKVGEFDPTYLHLKKHDS